MIGWFSELKIYRGVILILDNLFVCIQEINKFEPKYRNCS